MKIYPFCYFYTDTFIHEFILLLLNHSGFIDYFLRSSRNLGVILHRNLYGEGLNSIEILVLRGPAGTSLRELPTSQ